MDESKTKGDQKRYLAELGRVADVAGEPPGPVDVGAFGALPVVGGEEPPRLVGSAFADLDAPAPGGRAGGRGRAPTAAAVAVSAAGEVHVAAAGRGAPGASAPAHPVAGLLSGGFHRRTPATGQSPLAFGGVRATAELPDGYFCTKTPLCVGAVQCNAALSPLSIFLNCTFVKNGLVTFDHRHFSLKITHMFSTTICIIFIIFYDKIFC